LNSSYREETDFQIVSEKTNNMPEWGDIVHTKYAGIISTFHPTPQGMGFTKEQTTLHTKQEK
jgi:hypothetical protein